MCRDSFFIFPILGLILGIMSLPGTASCADLQVSATILLGKGTCSFKSVAPALFAPALDPFSASNRTADAIITVNCKGLGNKTGTVVVQRQTSSPLYLRRTLNPADTIAYSLNLPRSEPITNNSDLDIAVTATILGSAYQNAPAGIYSDTVGIEVLP
jgi:spore coat protein U-like protein